MKLLLTTFVHTSKTAERLEKTIPYSPNRLSGNYIVIKEKSWEAIESSLFKQPDDGGYLESIQKLMFELPFDTSFPEEFE